MKRIFISFDVDSDSALKLVAFYLEELCKKRNLKIVLFDGEYHVYTKADRGNVK